MNIVPYIKASCPILFVPTIEQERAREVLVEQINQWASEVGRKITYRIWNPYAGLFPMDATDIKANAKQMGLVDLMDEALKNDDVITDTNEDVEKRKSGEKKSHDVYFLFGTRPYLTPPTNMAVNVMLQKLRDVGYRLRMGSSTLIIIGGAFDIPDDIEDVVTVLDFPLPSKSEIEEMYVGLVKDNKEACGLEGIKKTEVKRAADAASGLTLIKAEDALSMSLAENKGVDIKAILDNKQEAIKMSGALEYIRDTENMDRLGGFDVLKRDVMKTAKYYTDIEAARVYGIDPPKGVFLLGLAGCGKSLAAKAIAGAMQLPLYRFDFGSVFKGIVGQSEDMIKRTLSIIETLAPAVIMLDEMDKLLAGAASSGRSDSGVTSRVIGKLLTWMQDTTAPIFKVATANTLRDLDPALIRLGRWDGVYGIDLPTWQERKDILSIHLFKRKRSPENFDLDLLASNTNGWVGAELENSIVMALREAYFQDRELTTKDILDVMSEIIPISELEKEQMTEFRQWLSERARSVSSQTDDRLNIKSKKKTQRRAAATPENNARRIKYN